MFAYSLRADELPSDQTNEFFRRFKDTPGLLHAYSLQGEDDPNDSIAVAIWESREAAERYLQSSPLKRDVDQAMPSVTRTFLLRTGQQVGHAHSAAALGRRVTAQQAHQAPRVHHALVLELRVERQVDLLGLRP